MITRFLRTLHSAMQGQPQGGCLADIARLGIQEPGFGLPNPMLANPMLPDPSMHGAALLGAKTRLHSDVQFGTRFTAGLGAIAGMVYAFLVGGFGLPISDPSLYVRIDSLGVPSHSAASRFSPIQHWLNLVDVRQLKSGRFRLRPTSP